ncbi:retinol dehydrogenase 11 [Octopus bimaculoides]|uniref:Uncharacterized protein n=1 Tax=Octopus bimaculoides TaxID=37653 RepID=A0A0L8G095_OCTBM|nr:retinol dehydrogenase 11 [Octopus bimaculoides]XP_014785264.1 retinol dehydrogenase 11 [Octopus bimaculoides]|eukprot:XP_014785262.1 PREDICTED: retinol dehydrogenase 11-like [Octopus bimaculoides]
MCDTMCPVCLFVIGFLIVGYLLLCVYLKSTRRYCRSEVDLTGKTVIVTGGNTGLGYITARELASRNARVILACRNAEKAETAVEKIISETGKKNIVSKKLDVSSLKSVREFAEQFLKEESRLDILINNAGIITNDSKLTEDGLQVTYATNHFGPFLLTNLLLERLKASTPSRVVTLSSYGHHFGKIHFENFKIPMLFEGSETYGSTKLANVLFTFELAKRVKEEGVTAYSVHPGLCKSNLFDSFHPILQWILLNLNPFTKSIEEGAQTTIYCAIEKGIEEHSGKYFDNLQVGCANAKGYDAGVAKKLWEVSESLTKLA